MRCTHTPSWHPSWLGSINAESLAEALTYATEIALDYRRRVRLYPIGRGQAGQLMWDIVTADGLAAG